LERYKELGFHRRRVGLNHIAFQAKSKADVDRLHSEFLVPRSIKVLYGGPKEYPEYRKGYYAVYFENQAGICPLSRIGAHEETLEELSGLPHGTLS